MLFERCLSIALRRIPTFGIPFHALVSNLPVRQAKTKGLVKILARRAQVEGNSCHQRVFSQKKDRAVVRAVFSSCYLFSPTRCAASRTARRVSSSRAGVIRTTGVERLSAATIFCSALRIAAA